MGGASLKITVDWCVSRLAVSLLWKRYSQSAVSILSKLCLARSDRDECAGHGALCQHDTRSIRSSMVVVVHRCCRFRLIVLWCWVLLLQLQLCLLLLLHIPFCWMNILIWSAFQQNNCTNIPVTISTPLEIINEQSIIDALNHLQGGTVRHVPRSSRNLFCHVLSTCINAAVLYNDVNSWVLLLLMPLYCLRAERAARPLQNMSAASIIKQKLNDFSKFKSALELMAAIKSTPIGQPNQRSGRKPDIRKLQLLAHRHRMVSSFLIHFSSVPTRSDPPFSASQKALRAACRA